MDGRGASMPDTFCRQPGRINGGTNGDEVGPVALDVRAAGEERRGERGAEDVGGAGAVDELLRHAEPGLAVGHRRSGR